MASAKKIGEFIASIKTIYPYYSKEGDSELLSEMWLLLLKGIPDEVANFAFLNCLKTCKIPPTPADVLEQVKLLSSINEPTDEELWGELLKALEEVRSLTPCFKYNFVEENGKTQGENAKADFQKLWNNLPEKLRRYLGNKEELRRMSKYDEEELKFEKNIFLKTMPAREKKHEMSLLLSGKNKGCKLLD